jgi:hypothetical protein
MWYDVFISYDPADREIADTVVRALKRECFAGWIAHRDRPSQAPTDESIDRAIRESRFVNVWSRVCLMIQAGSGDDWRARWVAS